MRLAFLVGICLLAAAENTVANATASVTVTKVGTIAGPVRATFLGDDLLLGIDAQGTLHTYDRKTLQQKEKTGSLPEKLFHNSFAPGDNFERRSHLDVDPARQRVFIPWLNDAGDSVLWDLKRSEVVAVLPGEIFKARRAFWLSASELVVANAREVATWNTETNEVAMRLRGYDGGFDMAPKARLAAAWLLPNSDNPGSYYVYPFSLPGFQQLKKLGHWQRVTAAAFGYDGLTMYSTQYRGILWKYDLKQMKYADSWTYWAKPSTQLACLMGDVYARPSRPGIIFDECYRNLAIPDPSGVVVRVNGCAGKIQWSPDSKLFLCDGDKKGMTVFEIQGEE